MTVSEEFDFIVKVMKSCETKEQLKSTKNMFENFKNKWKNKIGTFEMIDFMFKFEHKIKKFKEKLC